MPGGRAAFFSAVEHAPSERALAFALMDHGPRLTGAPCVGFYSLANPFTPREIHLRGLPERVADIYEARGRPIDPLLHRVARTHAVASSDFATLCAECPTIVDVVEDQAALMGLAHPGDYMLAPIIVGGDIVGMMNFATAEEHRLDIALGCAISIHVSARMAALRTVDSLPSVWDGALTTRQLEIATLAAQGMSTHQIARVAGVTANTVKKHLKQLYVELAVSSRAELAAALVRGPLAGAPGPSERSAPRHAVLANGVPVSVHRE